MLKKTTPECYFSFYAFQSLMKKQKILLPGYIFHSTNEKRPHIFIKPLWSVIVCCYTILRSVLLYKIFRVHNLYSCWLSYILYRTLPFWSLWFFVCVTILCKFDVVFYINTIWFKVKNSCIYHICTLLIKIASQNIILLNTKNAPKKCLKESNIYLNILFIFVKFKDKIYMFTEKCFSYCL